MANPEWFGNLVCFFLTLHAWCGLSFQPPSVPAISKKNAKLLIPSYIVLTHSLNVGYEWGQSPVSLFNFSLWQCQFFDNQIRAAWKLSHFVCRVHILLNEYSSITADLLTTNNYFSFDINNPNHLMQVYELEFNHSDKNM